MANKILIVHRSHKRADIEILDSLIEIFKFGGIEYNFITDINYGNNFRQKSTVDFIESNFIAIVYYNCSNFSHKIRLPFIWIIDINNEKIFIEDYQKQIKLILDSFYLMVIID